MRHRPEDVVEDEVADPVAERLPGILVIAEVLARVDTARCRLVGRLREALEAPLRPFGPSSCTNSPRARGCGIEPRASKTLGLRRCDLLASGVQALCQRHCILARRDLQPQPARPGLIHYLAGLLG